MALQDGREPAQLPTRLTCFDSYPLTESFVLTHTDHQSPRIDRQCGLAGTVPSIKPQPVPSIVIIVPSQMTTRQESSGPLMFCQEPARMLRCGVAGPLLESFAPEGYPLHPYCAVLWNLLKSMQDSRLQIQVVLQALCWCWPRAWDQEEALKCL